MNLVSLLVLIAVAGVALYLINALAPMDARVKKILNVLVVTVIAVIALVWLLGFLGVETGIDSFGPRMPRCR